MRLFLSPTHSLQVRGPDSYALTGGGFGARRTRGGKNYPHPGVDLVAPAGLRAVFPCSGIVTSIGPAYAKDLRYHWIRIRPEGLHDVEVVVGYVEPLGLEVGFRYPFSEFPDDSRARVDDVTLGTVEDLSGRYPDPDKAGPKKSITNHVHVEIRVNGRAIDPLPWLRASLLEV